MVQPSSVEPTAPLTAEEHSRATNLFTAQCAVCHGKRGRGDGISALRLAPAPTNFHEVQPSQTYAESALRIGISGSSMPKWEGKLTADEQRLLARYVRTLYAPKE